MNRILADAAKGALVSPGFASRKGLCQMWNRQVIESVYGSKYALYRAASAKDAALLWLKSPYGFAFSYLKDERGGLQAGDICYKTLGSGGYGHVGIYLGDGTIGENSSYHAHGNDTDARGIRTVALFGAFQVVVRLPEVAVLPIQSAPKPEPPLLVWNGNPFPVLFDADSRPYLQLAALCKKMGQTVIETTNRLDQSPPRFYVNSAAKGK